MNGFDPHDGRDRDADPERRTNGRSSPPSVVNLGINVGVQSLTDLLGGILDVSGSPRHEHGEWQVVDETGRADHETTSRRSVPETNSSVDGTDEYLIDTHQTEDELVVTAELPGISEDDLAVGIDVRSSDLVVSAEGETIDRISLPWSSTVAAKVWFNNGILEVRLKPATDGENGDERDEAS